MNRRSFFTAAALPALAAWPKRQTARDVVKPQRLREGQTVGVISPAGVTYSSETLDVMEERLDALGLKMKAGQHVMSRRGYLAGTDEQRAADVNAMFADSSVDAILCLRGGWGCARLLPLVDYDAARANPKILFGYSDVTALLLGLYAQAGLVGFHGPTGVSTYNAFTVDYLRRVLFEAEAVRFENPSVVGDELAQTDDRIRTITPGTATGRLVGGNLTVLSALVGSAYLPDFTGHVLFLEDIGEDVYRIDRMMTQLALAGILGQLAGFVFGKCTRCGADSGGYGSLTFEEVLHDHLSPLGIPAYSGAMIGHIEDKFTVPVGISARISAEAGTLTLLEPAVV
ncbi:MAG: LD-carboxypeptidase [Bacteroidota bacterium]